MICIKTVRFWLACCAAAPLAGCGYLPTIDVLPTVSPYRIDIQQGNYLSQEMVSKLQPGMSKEQVRFVLGTPLVTDIFHGDRWDYVYYRDVRGQKPEQRRLSVFFEKDQLVRLSGDVVPAPAKPAADAPAAPGAASTSSAPPPDKKN